MTTKPKTVSVRIVPFTPPHAVGCAYSVVQFNGNGQWTGASFHATQKDAQIAAHKHRKYLRKKLGYRVIR